MGGCCNCTIFKNHIFARNLSAPTTLNIKEWRDAETDSKRDFVNQGTNRPDRAQLMKQYQLQQLKEPGLKEINQVELWTKWRKFIPLHFQSEICPEPEAAVLQRIKNEKLEKLKKTAKKKKKKREQPPMDNNLATASAIESDLGTITAMESL
jgi:hypothetical protein